MKVISRDSLHRVADFCGASATPIQTTTSGGPPTWLPCLTPLLHGKDPMLKRAVQPCGSIRNDEHPYTQARAPRYMVWAAWLVLVGALGPLAAAAPIAHADASDDAFVVALAAKGIHFGSPNKAFIAGHEVCDELGNGKSAAQVASPVQSNSNMDGYHSGFFVGASIRAYCPQYAS